MGKTMKHNILSLLLLLLSATGSLAQSNNDTAEVKAALDEFLAENAASSYNFFQNRLTPDFRYINPRGAISLRADVLKTHEADKSKGTKSEVSDLKIFRSGDLAVVSGIHNFSGWRTGFTYTMEKQKGNGAAPRWMFAASEHTPVRPVVPASEEEAAIRTVLEGSSQASMDKDVDKHLSYYAQSPNVAVSYNAPGYPRGYDGLADTYRKNAGTPQKSPNKLTTSDYLYRIVDNTAFVTYIETFTKPDGTASKMHKADYLEKISGQWKLIGNFWAPENKPK